MNRATSYSMRRSPIQLDEGFSETHSQQGSDTMDDGMGLPAGSDALVEHIKMLSATVPSTRRLELIEAIAATLSTSELLGLHKRIGSLIYFDPVRYLPTELILNIFSHLSPHDLLTASTVSRPWREATQDERLWHDNFYREGWAVERTKLGESEQLARQNGPKLAERMMRTSQPGMPLQRRASRKRPRNEAFSEDEIHRTQNDECPSSTAVEMGDVEGASNMEGDMEGVEVTGTSEHRDSNDSQTSVSTNGTSVDMSGEQCDEQEQDAMGSALVLSPSVFTQPSTDREQPKVSWPWLYKQRRRLESNWDAGKYTTFRLPHPDHEDEGHRECVYTIQHSGDDLVSGSRDKTIRCWDLRTQRLRIPELKGHEASVLCLQFDARKGDQHDIIVSGGSDNNVIIWRFSTGALIRKMPAPHSESVLNLRFDDRYLVTCSKDKTIKIWNRHAIANNDPIIPVRVLADFAEGPDRLAPFTLLDTLIGHQAAVNAVQISDNVIVSASGDRTIKSWDLHSPREGPSHRKSYTGHTKGIACVQFDGRRIVSGSSDNSVRIFDYDTTAEVACLDGHSNLVRTVQARFGDMDTVTNEELAEEAKEADRKFLKALDEGLRPVEPARVRRSRNAGSGRPADMLSYGTKIPPGGGGSRWSKIVSGSYDETIIIWKRDPNKAGKWRPNVRLHQGSLAFGHGNNRARGFVDLPPGINVPPLNMLQPTAQDVEPAQAANATQQAHMILQQAQNSLAWASVALNNATAGQQLLPHAQMAAVTTAQASVNQPLQNITDQAQQQANMQAVHVGNYVPPAPPAPPIQQPPAQPNVPAPPQPQHNHGPAQASANTLAPHNGTAIPTTAAVPPAAQVQPHAAPPPHAPAVPAHHHHHGAHHHHHPHGHGHGHGHGPRTESNRVFKLQFDARRIIACSQNKVIVGWDFANGDKDLEWIGDWSRETN